MEEEIIQIAFNNNQNPKAQFDLVKIEDIVLEKKDLDHSPFLPHTVGFYMILFFENKQGKHTIDFKTYDYKKGTLFTIKKNQVHKFQKNLEVKGTALLFTDDFLISYLGKTETQKTFQLFNEFLHSPKKNLNSNQRTDIESSIARIQKEYFSISDSHSLSVIRSELHILITKIFRIKIDPNSTINQNKKYLNAFSKLQLLIEENSHKYRKVSDYSQLMGTSTKTLNNITKQVIHKSAKEFVDEICTHQIKRRLINSSDSIKEIAYQSGFDEVTNFYKYFKRQTQMTPESFREIHK